MVHNRPHYENLRNKHLYLAYTNKSDYPTPWTMWGGTLYPTGSFMGNIKIGPPSAKCPEQNKEKGKSVLPPVTLRKYSEFHLLTGNLFHKCYFAFYFVNFLIIANILLGPKYLWHDK